LLLAVFWFVITLIKAKPYKEIPNTTISLEELSKIWMPYNQSVQDVPISSENIDMLFDLDNKKEDNQQEAQGTGENNNGSKKQENALDFSLVSPVKDFWTTYIQPYKNEISNQGVGPVIQELILQLEKYGQNPSVVIDNRDSESVELVSVRDNLAQVSLREHSYHVCAFMIDIVKETYRDYNNLIPKAIVTSLAHDIGKIPEYRVSGVYNAYDHPLVSAGKLAEIFAGHDVFWAKQVIQSVKEHHIASKDQWTILLKRADRQAREMELLKFTSQYEIKPFESWFNVDTFLEELKNYINVTQMNKWEAFSYNGVVYCRPELIFSIAKKMCRDAKVLDLAFVYESEKETVFRLVVSALRKENCIPDVLGQGYSRKFEIKTKVGMVKSIKYVLTPIVSEKLITPEIEGRKQGLLEIISAVIPL